MQRARARIVMATVKGDVHDIGKNIVGVVLQCNNFEVIDLGVMVPLKDILDTAEREQADIIGLSGLITPSLDEMVFVAREMEKRGLKLPLLIGGATTSRAHTAVRIVPAYSGPTIHVRDASRAAGVVGQLTSNDQRPIFLEKTALEYEKLRERHSARQQQPRLIPLTQARQNRAQIEFTSDQIHVPSRLGIQILDPYPLEELVADIDWTPFFMTWELAGRYPRILDDDIVGKQARQLYDDALRLLGRIVEKQLLTPRAVFGLFPANSTADDDILIFSDETRRTLRTRAHTLRQQVQKPEGQPNFALSDFIAPLSSKLPDYLGAFAVSAGDGLDPLVAEFEAEHDDYHAIMAKALADRLAEALAERLHCLVRTRYWGYAKDENFDNEALIAEKYSGIRPAPGYPACPDHTEKAQIWSLLDVERTVGIKLTESFAMLPAAAVSGWYFGHPQARYFGVGRIGRDQVEDYAARKGMEIAAAERWLAPNLNYEADD